MQNCLTQQHKVIPRKLKKVLGNDENRTRDLCVRSEKDIHCARPPPKNRHVGVNNLYQSKEFLWVPYYHNVIVVAIFLITPDMVHDIHSRFANLWKVSSEGNVQIKTSKQEISP